MTPEQVAETIEHHGLSDHGNYCEGCGEDYPCDITTLVAEVRRLQDALATTAQIAATNGVEMLRAQGRAERAEAEVDDAEDRYNDLLSKIGGTL